MMLEYGRGERVWQNSGEYIERSAEWWKWEKEEGEEEEEEKGNSLSVAKRRNEEMRKRGNGEKEGGKERGAKQRQ